MAEKKIDLIIAESEQALTQAVNEQLKALPISVVKMIFERVGLQVDKQYRETIQKQVTLYNDQLKAEQEKESEENEQGMD